VKRFGYNRFGPDAMIWSKSTFMEYIYTGVTAASGFYIFSSLFLLIMSIFGRGSPVSFWRYLLLVGLAALELLFVTRAERPWLLSLLFPRRVTYQHVLFVHQVYISTSIALSRVFPVLFAPDPIQSNDPRTLQAVIDNIASFVNVTDQTINRMIREELRTMQPPPGADDLTGHRPTVDGHTIDVLSIQMEHLMIDNSIRTHPGIRPSWDAAVARFKEGKVAREKTASLEDHEPPSPHNHFSTPLPSPPRSPSPELKFESLVKRVLSPPEDGADGVVQEQPS